MPKTGFEMGAGHRMIQAFTLDPASTNTLVEVTNTSTRVEFSVDLESHRRGPFAGIDGNGTWFVALLCGECRNPAPWYLSILTPCTPGEP